MKKKWIAALAAFGLLTGLLAGCGAPQENKEPAGAEGDLLDKITASGVLVIGTEGTYAPNSYHDENDNLTGFDVEVGRAIAEELGVKAEFVEAEWDSLFAGLDSGRVDVIINEVEYSQERAEKYDFSQPYTYVHGALLVAQSNEDILRFEDLAGKRAAQNLTSSWGKMAESYGAEIVSVDAMHQTMEQITTGRADATLNAETAFSYYLAAHPETPVKIAATTDITTSSQVPVPKGNGKLVAAIDKALDTLRASGRLAELSRQFFGVDVTSK